MAPRAESSQQPAGASRNDRDYEIAPIVVVTGATVEPQPRIPGPGILKTAKSGKNSNSSPVSKQKVTPDCSPSKQPLIGPELRYNDSVGSFLNETTSIPAATKVTATIIVSHPATSSSIITVAGTTHNSKSRVPNTTTTTTLTTFGDKNKNITKTSESRK